MAGASSKSLKLTGVGTDTVTLQSFSDPECKEGSQGATITFAKAEFDKLAGKDGCAKFTEEAAAFGQSVKISAICAKFAPAAPSPAAPAAPSPAAPSPAAPSPKAPSPAPSPKAGTNNTNKTKTDTNTAVGLRLHAVCAMVFVVALPMVM